MEHAADAAAGAASPAADLRGWRCTFAGGVQPFLRRRWMVDRATPNRLASAVTFNGVGIGVGSDAVGCSVVTVAVASVSAMETPLRLTNQIIA
jgi:hypothetical protein